MTNDILGHITTFHISMHSFLNIYIKKKKILWPKPLKSPSLLC